MGVYVGSHVIPRPDDSVEKIIKRKLGASEQKEEVVEEAPAAPTELEVLQEIKALLEKK